jgi:hypothetical protein
MPQGRAELRKKFLVDGDDGIARCEDILRKAGARVCRGWIAWPDGDYSEEFYEAAEYLITEWDYAYGDGPTNGD